MPVRLVPADSGNPIKLDKPVLLIGRNPDCDVILTASRKVSRAHCLVACVNNQILVRDLGSTNGVWVNGQRVERESRLRLGDELSVADVQYQLLNVDANDANGGQQPKPAVPSRERKIVVANQPVAIPEQDDSFLVEASMPRLPKITPARLAAAADSDSSCDVIPLDEKILADPRSMDAPVPLRIPDTGSEIEQAEFAGPATNTDSDSGEFRMSAELDDDDDSEEALSILDSVDESDDIIPLAPIDED